jgi:predicted nucleotidyltransferase
MLPIAITEDQIAEFCRKHHIRKMALFGSVLRDDFRPDSDVDVLVEFEPGQGPGYMGLVAMETELSELFGGRSVDLVTYRGLSHRLKDRILASQRVIYGEG